jgi:hypothetical protein
VVFGLGIELVVGPGAELAVVGPGIEVVVGPGIELAAGLWVGLVVGPESEDLVVVGAGIELAAGLWVGLVVGPENEVVVCPVTESVVCPVTELVGLGIGLACLKFSACVRVSASLCSDSSPCLCV